MVDYLYSTPAEARNEALSFEGREGARDRLGPEADGACDVIESEVYLFA